uniref:Glycosyltransferase 2-like domain-containing protein n=1 Tax=viral metagenome TaxID=1070528 RepID=A0A6C0JXH7_9ZZZZ
MLVSINNKSYSISSNEFNTVIHNEYNNLAIKADLGKMERICSLLRELKLENMDSILLYNSTHGGFIPISISDTYKNIYLLNTLQEQKENIAKNISNHNIENINWELTEELSGFVMYSEKSECIDMSLVMKHRPIVVTPASTKIFKTGLYKTVLQLTDSNITVYVPDKYSDIFYENFKYYIITVKDEEFLQYDNLIDLCIMVKNGGEQFEQMLENNIHLIDKWTILDTGSTDDTINIINKTLVGKKKGKLYQEKFINFRDSRNRLLELAGETCKYTLMLDDTYVVKGDLRSFLNEVRGDQFADSFSLYIKSDDVEYGSNRILRTDRHLKYLFKIHEVIQENNNMNVVIPLERCYIMDGRYEYMEERTMQRKQLDLQLLKEEINENPHNPRSYYYMAQTYNLLKDYENAYKYFMLRAEHHVEGFLQEKIDAIFECARCANFKLNKPWSECEVLYKRAYELDKSRPDSIYFLGIHYFLEGNKKTAYEYFKLAFEIGYPIHCQYSLKPTLSYHFLPKFLAQLCYEFKNYTLGEQCSLLFLEKNTPDADQYNIIVSWYAIFVKLNQMNNMALTIDINDDDKPLLCFVADGGFEPWTGKDILTKGVGGSETYIIEMARYIQKRGHYKVIVFCNCLEQTSFENVEYIPIIQFMPFAKKRFIHTCIISRFSEYIPVAIEGNVENIYMVLHDLTPSGIIIPISDKLKNIFCLSEWHVEYFTAIFPQFKDITVPFYYGIDMSLFDCENPIRKYDENAVQQNIQISMVECSPKTPFKFIYSSYPNRGLYELLLMWPHIVKKYPDANLHIYSDIDGKWVNTNYSELMQKIRDLYVKYENIPGGLNIYKYGWVCKNTLAEAWKTAEYWLYPCTFMETFCLTALEAALSKTVAITNGLAALKNTVGNRGICIEGDPSSLKWREDALESVFEIIENRERIDELLVKNYEWAKNMAWEKRACHLLDDYINTNRLEYRGMYNWMHDLPKGTNAKMKFEKAIEYYVNKNMGEQCHWILEIGVYTGTSLIEIVKRIPNSFGLGIDKWENYNEDNIDILQNMEQNNIEKIWNRNIKAAGLENRIKAIKGDSSDILLELISEKMQYDFIYVDGSHKCLDVALDLHLAWKLLRIGGVMAIDDYMYNADKITEKPYEYPYEAVNHFLEKIGGKYTLIDKDYRVFIERLK